LGRSARPEGIRIETAVGQWPRRASRQRTRSDTAARCSSTPKSGGESCARSGRAPRRVARGHHRRRGGGGERSGDLSYLQAARSRPRAAVV